MDCWVWLGKSLLRSAGWWGNTRLPARILRSPFCTLTTMMGRWWFSGRTLDAWENSHRIASKGLCGILFRSPCCSSGIGSEEAVRRPCACGVMTSSRVLRSAPAGVCVLGAQIHCLGLWYGSPYLTLVLMARKLIGIRGQFCFVFVFLLYSF